MKSVWKTELEDVLPDGPGSACYCCTCFVVNVVLIILFFPCTMTQLGQFKYGLLKNKATGYVDLDTTYEPGRYWIGFWKEFIEFPSTLNTVEFSEEAPEEGVLHLNVLQSRDKDGKLVLLDISVQYLLEKKNIGQLYKTFLLSYEDIYISELRDQFAKAANLFRIQDMWENYNSVVELMRIRCEAVLKARLSICWGLQIWGVSLTKGFEDKLIETQVKKQAQRTKQAEKAQAEVRATTAVILAEYRKNITILQSGGLAAKYQIERLAYATAQANTISAQARGIQIVANTVCPKNALVYDEEIKTSICRGNSSMTFNQLVSYQHKVLLKSLKVPNMVYQMQGKKHNDMVNIAAQRNIMHGRARRLLLHDSQYDQDRDARKLMKHSGYSSSGPDAEREHQRMLYREAGWRPETVSVDETTRVMLGTSDSLASSHEL